jgi:hypothetical protein
MATLLGVATVTSLLQRELVAEADFDGVLYKIYYEKNVIHSKNRTWVVLNLDFIIIINFEKEV